ncbi:uncharacterized protein LOC133835016 [Drosophila sulfurigaster albostrigata]|uniref:uncharacterized protein LOC133835016 n=1 Tax=Drosophila sulfurigaster albostrigata TaxID=89887 RepID=UPI002D21EAD2|nr:uncharacterized protein LOC133835016 [Drosophila sulfurigaster albostrigata]XP_062120845.1 uncharacterized protein LOC133835016 [Drosophila sulfurigaster albostrigata]
MGCITSTNKLHELRQENVFRVRVAHLQPSGPEAPIIRSGYLELTPRELIFLTPGYDPIVWALQHLRRYGLNGDLFSFEAGRRCMSGPGIYTFRIHNAEQLYPMFQRYINAVNTDAFAQVERERERVNSTHSVSVLMGRSDVQPHSNNYLEPAPMMARAALQVQQSANELSASATNDSPEQLPNLQLNMGEMSATTATGNLQSPITPGAYINTNTNVYFDQPLQRLLQEQNSRSSPSEATPTSSNSGFSTMRRQQPISADLPPQESAPALNETLRLYANVETPRERQLFETPLGSAGCNERCYENINRLDLPLLPRDCSQQSVASITQVQQQQQQQQQPPQPVTPTSLPGVNYIVLDLDQPRSPAQSSPKTVTNGFGSGLSLTAAATAPVTPEGQITTDPTQSAQNRTSNAVATAQPATATTTAAETVATQGYSTIDFIRTYALNKSSTAPTNHDGEVATICQPQQQHQDHTHEDCELRITRHSKCVRKAYSISE